jgi:excisionase family DNA binding protein
MNTLEQYFLTVAEAANHLSVSTKTIRNWIKQGYLEAERRGPRIIVITLDALDAVYRPYKKDKRRYTN